MGLKNWSECILIIKSHVSNSVGPDQTDQTAPNLSLWLYTEFQDSYHTLFLFH